MERRFVCAALLAALVTLSTSSAIAETYPSRPIHLVVPFGAGGVADVSSRIVADKLGDRLGQRFVIDNMPGAGGIAAARNALATTISVSLFANLPFNPLKDFTPISTLGYFDCLFVTNAASEFRTLGDFLKAARAKPSALNVGTVNPGSTQHLTAELFKSTAGVNFVIVPFRTTPEAVIALAKRSPALPDVPTVEEGGVAGFNVSSWNALYAPSGVPVEATETINRGLHTVLADPEVKRRLLDLGIDSKASTPTELDERMRADIKKWAEVIERAGIAKQ